MIHHNRIINRLVINSYIFRIALFIKKPCLYKELLRLLPKHRLHATRKKKTYIVYVCVFFVKTYKQLNAWEYTQPFLQ